ncbi:flagellar biosynthetic protein FliR, partial [Adlercreutzia rubneri]|nr:flagellar biosynthetic protein FliR [Adlercreutzia rubneri]
LLAAILMAAMQIAGGLIDFQIGFAIANVIDPQTGAQSPLLGEYLHLLALLLLLALDGHHLLLDGMFYSYHWLPLDRLPHIADGQAVEYVVRVFAAM